MTVREIIGGVHILDGSGVLGKGNSIIGTGLVRGRRGCNRRYQRRAAISNFAAAGIEHNKENVEVPPMKSILGVLPYYLTPPEFPLDG